MVFVHWLALCRLKEKCGESEPVEESKRDVIEEVVWVT